MRLETLHEIHRHSDRRYCNELHSYARARERESSCAAQLDMAERRLWSALTAARDVRVGSSRRGINLPVLEQARRLLAESEKAKVAQDVASRAVRNGQISLSRALHRCQTLRHFVDRETRKKAYIKESHASDLTQEMCVARDAQRLAGSRFAAARKLLASAGQQEGDQRVEKVIMECASTEPRSTRCETQGRLDTDPVVSQRTPNPAPSEMMTIASCEGSTPNVMLETSLGSLGTVRLRVSRSGAAGVSIGVNPAHAMLAKELERERSRIISRVSSQGIRVSSLEVTAMSSGSIAYRAKRQKLRGDERGDDYLIT